MVESNTAQLSDRAQQLLRALIERFIREGEPVGSRTLAREAGMDLSPATVRNVMADLEEMGLVASPHTSAGRVPTVQGYRFFVNTLLTIRWRLPAWCGMPWSTTAAEKRRSCGNSGTA